MISACRFARWPRALLFGVWALQIALAGCSNTRRLPSPFIFNSPGDVALACFDEEPASDDHIVLPLECCASDIDRKYCPRELDERLRHALVTQTQRGEVAAIDLVHAKVLDSERRVPGYTFVDVGGLPAAIVVPQSLPGRPARGAPWTYVAGREVNSIRAIATCRFRIGEKCGPELQIDADPEKARAQTEVTLPEPPQDMLLDPGGNALWVSLPKAALIARIDLDALEPIDEPSIDDPPPFVWPFATDGNSGVPRDPTYFEVPSGISLEPEEPVVIAGDDEYRSVCGTGYAFVASPVALPLAQRETSSRRALPTRLRFLPNEPGAVGAPPTPVLFVADAGQAVLHAFAIVDGALQQRGALGLGARLRDFALTAQVPRLAPSVDALVNPDTFAYATPPADDTRYLFGIDDRDGSLMAFELGLSEQSLSLKPLVAPVPARQEVDSQHYARDRLAFDGISARALDVVDTRYRALAEWDSSQDAYRDPLYCGEMPLAAIDEAIADAKRNHAKEEEEELEEVRDWTELGARSDVLRGVFLVVASSLGQLSVIDVHDLDLQCRARAGCDPDTGETDQHSEDTSASALVARRHARRVLTAEEAHPLITSPDQLVSMPEEMPQAGCSNGYYTPTEDDFPLCVSSDPWQTRNVRWSVVYEGPTSVPGNVLLSREAGSDRITLVGPQTWDFCARGANVADRLKVAIVSQPDPDIDGCETYSYRSEPELFVVEAYQDHLVLAAEPPEEGGEEPDPDAGEPDPDAGEPDPDAGEPDPDAGEPDPDAGEPDPDAGEPDPDEPDAGAGGEDGDAAVPPSKVLDELMRCYPGFVTAEIRLHDQFLVTYGSGTTTPGYQHRNHANDAGECVTNEQLDPRLTSRISGPDWKFQDFALEFTLVEPQEDRDDIAPIVELTSQSSYLGVLNVDSSSGRSDALPSRVRFFPGTDDLFIVDGASQGLRRYELEPFQHDGEHFR